MVLGGNKTAQFLHNSLSQCDEAYPKKATPHSLRVHFQQHENTSKVISTNLVLNHTYQQLNIPYIKDEVCSRSFTAESPAGGKKEKDDIYKT